MLKIQTEKSGRFQSLDVMRGLVMIFLAAESCLLYEYLDHAIEGNVIIKQFFHHPWNGLRFWDLVQPAFMTIAGTALYISFTRKGVSWAKNFPHIGVRCFRLLLCGLLLHSIQAGKPVWELWNVLCQLAVTTLIAYRIIKWSVKFQLSISILLLLLTELCYRLYGQPFIQHENFGSWMDMLLMGKLNTDGWVAINFLPTAAHTIWGVLIGKVLLSSNRKISTLLIAGSIGLIAGYGLDWAGVTPIIKRIATSSFVLASGGWVALMVAFMYWIIDVKQQNRFAWITVVVGMNPIFLYMLFETVGHQWLNGAVSIFVHVNILSALVTLGLYWWLCYWLYKKGIFFKL